MNIEDDRVLTDKIKPTFKTSPFEGPLDLLLYYISKNKINIYDIPISEITEQFISYIEEHKVDLSDCSEFYKMAADLLYIKSRMLLPVEVEFDEEYEDPRQELVERLIEYQKIKKYTQLLMGASEDANLLIQRKENFFMLPYTDEELFKNVDLNLLLTTFYNILSKKISPNKIFNIYEDVKPAEKIALINELLETNEKITIEQVIVHMDKKIHIICAFMAILEAAKDNLIMLYQEGSIIYIMKKNQDYELDNPDLYDDEYDEIIDNDLVDKDDYSIIDDDEYDGEEEDLLIDED